MFGLGHFLKLLSYRATSGQTGGQVQGSVLLSLCPQVQATIHENGVAILDAGRGVVYTANRSAAVIWQGIVNRQSSDEIAARISNQYGLPADKAKSDTVKYLTDLLAQGLVQTIAEAL